MVVKECLGRPTAVRLALGDLARVAPARRWLLRQPASEGAINSENWKFAMLKWLDPAVESRWDWATEAYLGLAFD